MAINRGILVAGGLIAIVACTEVPAPPKNAELRWLPHLIYNETAARVAVKESAAEGLKDLEKLVDTEQHEEAYAFFPQTQEWIEIGVQSMNLNDGTRQGKRVNFDETIVGAYLQKNPDIDQVDFVHYHPKQVRKKAETNYRQQAAQAGMNPNIANTVARVLGQLPSGTDAHAAITYTTWLRKKKPTLKITFKVVGEEGMVSFQLTEEGISHYTSMPSEERERRAQTYARLLEKSNEHTASAAALNDTNPIKAIEEACKLHCRGVRTSSYEPTQTPQLYFIDYQFKRR